MEVGKSIFDIRNYLKDENLSDKRKLEFIANAVDNDDRYKFHSTKELLLRWANDSGAKKFRLVATMNSDLYISNWCNAQQNFLGMCFKVYDDDDKDYTVEYTLKELPEMINNAEEWLESLQSKEGISGNPYFISDLQIMKV